LEWQPTHEFMNNGSTSLLNDLTGPAQLGVKAGPVELLLQAHIIAAPNIKTKATFFINKNYMIEQLTTV
jgi:hypothetical protein